MKIIGINANNHSYSWKEHEVFSIVLHKDAIKTLHVVEINNEKGKEELEIAIFKISAQTNH